MSEPLSAEDLAALDLLQEADLQVFLEGTLNRAAEDSRDNHGAPDFSEHVPLLAERLAQALAGNLAVVANPDQGRVSSTASFSLIRDSIGETFDALEIGREQYFHIDFMIESWISSILRALLAHPQIKALRA